MKILTSTDFIGKVQEHIDKFIVEERRSAPLQMKRFRASGIGADPREMILGMMNLPKDKYPRAYKDTAVGYKLMDKGTGVHEAVQGYLQRMGVLKKKDTEKVIVDDDLLFSGHCDGVLTFSDKQILLEIKTINGRGFDYITRPKEGHVYQAHAYAYFVSKHFGYKLNDILFIYVDRERDQTDMKEFLIPVDPNICDMIVNKLTTLKEYLKRRQIPPAHPNYDPKKAPWIYSEYNTPLLYGSGITDMNEYEGVNILANI